MINAVRRRRQRVDARTCSKTICQRRDRLREHQDPAPDTPGHL